MKCELNQNLAGNEVYNTNSLISPAKNMLCSKHHCQKGFNLIPFSYKISWSTASAVKKRVPLPEEAEFFIDNLLVRIHLSINEIFLVDWPCAMGV
jgi:hypothetical protein